MFKLYEIHFDRILLTLNVFTQHSSNKSRLYIVLYLLTHSKQVPVRLSHFLCLLPLVFVCFFDKKSIKRFLGADGVYATFVADLLFYG